ncbi:MAG: metallophosphoesterase family protein [Elusimicrobia bacterium]|nr:metallophosphoesterase family protein [Elusimicrobiota bacterium]
MLPIGPSSLRGLSDEAGLRSRRALGHYRLGELAAVAAVCLGVVSLFAAALGSLAGLAPFQRLPEAGRWAILAAAGATGLCMAYALLVETKRLTVRSVAIMCPKATGRGLRLLHLSDLHVHRWGRLEDAVVRQARMLRPDLILVAGDYTAVPCHPPDARRLIAELAPIAPTFGCRGNGDYRPPPYGEIFEGTGAILLLNETREVSVAGMTVLVTGVEPGHEEKVLAAPPAGPGQLSICLYHYPDLVPRLAEIPFDLMLCGHTHGGQVRLPWVGAVVSFSRAGTRYARGLFRAGAKHAFVTQGVGCESYGLAPLRFLCPPELVLITLSKTTPSGSAGWSSGAPSRRPGSP